MIPVIAIVGRPNVGKSTLFNRITRSRDALVADEPGITRDRQYGRARLNGQSFIVVDTGGLSGDTDGIDSGMAEQVRIAIDEADVTLFLVDGRAGLQNQDMEIAQQLRGKNDRIRLVVNKTEGQQPDTAVADFHSLGLGQPLAISSEHGHGVNAMLESVLDSLDVTDIEDDDEQQQGIKIAVIGRPNVGKSTLINALVGENRVVAYDQPGTTRDSIFVPFTHKDRIYTLIDTAGVRRRTRVNEAIEKFSVIKTLRALETSNVVIMVMDAQQNIGEQDLRLLGYTIDEGKALVIAVNKWDGLSEHQREEIKETLNRKLTFADYAKIHFVSALRRRGIDKLMESVNIAYQSATKEIATAKLTTVLERAVQQNPPPSRHGRRIKLRYAHQGGRNPPMFVVHGTQVEALPPSYTRYLANTFAREFQLQGTPVRIRYKQGENPYESTKAKPSRDEIRKKKLQRRKFN